jgi:hypothetical protein
MTTKSLFETVKCRVREDMLILGLNRHVRP